MKNRLPPTFAKHLKPAPRPAVKPVQRTQSDDETLKLAMALHLEGKLREAEQLCFRLLMRNPRNAKALYLAGMLALDIEDSDLAIQYLERAVKEMPREPQVSHRTGECLSRQPRIRNCHQALRQRSFGPAQISVEALVGLARAHIGAGTAEAALSLFEKALKIDPEHTTARLGWADAMTSLGRMDDAAGNSSGLDRTRQGLSARPTLRSQTLENSPASPPNSKPF